MEKNEGCEVLQEWIIDVPRLKEITLRKGSESWKDWQEGRVLALSYYCQDQSEYESPTYTTIYDITSDELLRFTKDKDFVTEQGELLGDIVKITGENDPGILLSKTLEYSPIRPQIGRYQTRYEKLRYAQFSLRTGKKIQSQTFTFD